MSASGTWTTTSVKTIGWGALILVCAFAVLGVLLWPILVVIGNIVWLVLTHVWAALPYVVCLELAVVFSAALDWFEARMAVRSYRHGWLLAHITLWRRLARRASWLWTLANAVRKQRSKPTGGTPEPAAVPAYTGIVLEHDDVARAA